jgi:hypothetical protein
MGAWSPVAAFAVTGRLEEAHGITAGAFPWSFEDFWLATSWLLLIAEPCLIGRSLAAFWVTD